MKISKEEQAAIKVAVAIGARWGYGNLMNHLASAWAESLVAQGLPESTAIEATKGREPYPLVMHRDLVDRGEWDETGRKYQTGAADE